MLQVEQPLNLLPGKQSGNAKIYPLMQTKVSSAISIFHLRLPLRDTPFEVGKRDRKATLVDIGFEQCWIVNHSCPHFILHRISHRMELCATLEVWGLGSFSGSLSLCACRRRLSISNRTGCATRP